MSSLVVPRLPTTGFAGFEDVETAKSGHDWLGLMNEEIHSNLNRLGASQRYETNNPTATQLAIHYRLSGGYRRFLNSHYHLVTISET